MSESKLTKFKIFHSFYSERDWLETMAAQGWLLENLDMGMVYHFKKTEPCQKVYEIERFAITNHPTISELTARANALDITAQFGWEQVAHDEDMNYYFMKDKAGDETDEFYVEPEERRARAERYRKFYAIESPLLFLPLPLIVAIACAGFHLFLHISLWPLMVITNVTCLIFIYYFNVRGQHMYREFCMSREEWEQYKQFSEKKRFLKVQQLRSFLQEKSELGLSLTGYEYGRFLFTRDTTRYNYFADTKRCLKKRLKERDTKLTDEKDLLSVGLRWYEKSIANATEYGLKPVAVIGKTVLIYKRPYSDAPLPWENGNERIGNPVLSISLRALALILLCFVLGYIVGYVLGSII